MKTYDYKSDKKMPDNMDWLDQPQRIKRLQEELDSPSEGWYLVHRESYFWRHFGFVLFCIVVTGLIKILISIDLNEHSMFARGYFLLYGSFILSLTAYGLIYFFTRDFLFPMPDFHSSELNKRTKTYDHFVYFGCVPRLIYIMFKFCLFIAIATGIVMLCLSCIASAFVFLSS